MEWETLLALFHEVDLLNVHDFIYLFIFSYILNK